MIPTCEKPVPMFPDLLPVFFDGAVDDKGWANAFILLQGMFNISMG